MRTIVLSCLVFLLGCDVAEPTDAGTPDVDGAVVTDAGGSDAGDDAGGPEADWVVNLVFPGGPTAVQEFLDGSSEAGLWPIASAFYDTYDDEFDFLYLLAEVDHGTGRFVPAHRPAMPENGITSGSDDPRFGSPSRLRATIAMRLGDSGNGPTLHETSHFWGVFLDASFGFGRDRTMSFGPHWGLASVNGQLGGFDGSTLRCVVPDGAAPPCDPEASGRVRVTVDSFGPAANGGDSVPYAPIELYLMGLIPASEVTEPLTMLREADFIEEVPGTGRFLFEIDAIDTITIDDITAVHGEKPSVPAAERAFRGAFVLVSETPASDASMQAARRWSRVFAGEERSSVLLGFEDATGGRASMDTRIVPR